MAPVATEFEKIIHSARERKKNEALADKIFSRGRRQSAPLAKLKPAAGASLASRVGVKKPQQQQQQRTAAPKRRRASLPTGNVDGEWINDLHNTVNSNGNGNGNGGGSLRSRITLPGAGFTYKNAAGKKKVAKLSAALDRMDTDDSVKQQVNVVNRQQSRGPGMTIRGLAGPFAVMAQNFAPGTTAADVESAMTPVGGEMVSCVVVKTQPFIIVEMAFASREGGERVIEMFDNKTADGRIIKVYPKPGGYQPQPERAASSSARSSSRDQIVDGTMGFSEDLMDAGHIGSSSGDNRLHYSDRNGAPNKRGRGFQKGRGSR